MELNNILSEAGAGLALLAIIAIVGGFLLVPLAIVIALLSWAF